MPDYGYKVVYANPKLLEKAGYGALSHQPFLLDPEPGYARLPNQFLIDRGLGYWEPKWRGEKRNPIPPSRVSMLNFARWLANALEWADTRSIDLMHGDYVSDLIGRYVPGNHEFYGREHTSHRVLMRRLAGELGIHLLDGDTIDIDGVRFIGATL